MHEHVLAWTFILGAPYASRDAGSTVSTRARLCMPEITGVDSIVSTSLFHECVPARWRHLVPRAPIGSFHIRFPHTRFSLRLVTVPGCAPPGCD
eukprot:scaffold907_cov318-Pavlova_lutheri.AAC.4